MRPVLALARLALYAAVAAGAAFSPDVAHTIALLPAVHPAAAEPALASESATTLGWLARALADALVRAFGFGGLAFATALALVGTLACVEWRARLGAPSALALAATLLGAACLLDSVHVGAGAANGLFFAALLAAWELPGRRALAGTALVTALWCNASPAGILAPTFAAAFALGMLADRAAREARLRAQLLAMASALATLATPAFLAFPVQAWRAIGLDAALEDVLPSSPVLVAPLAYHAGIFLTIVVALVIGVRAARTGDTFVFVLAALYAFSKGAFVPFVGIAAAPILAERASRSFGWLRTAGAHLRAPAFELGASALAVALAVGVIGASARPRVPLAANVSPYGALAAYARTSSERGAIFCTKLQWCDVAERSFGLRVFADSHLASAPQATIAAALTIAAAEPGWKTRSKQAAIDAIFADKRSGFATVLVADGWRPFAVDGNGEVFVRGNRTL